MWESDQGEVWHMDAGDWVLYYPNDLDADMFHQVRILYWVDAHGAVIRYPDGREDEVAAYKLAMSFATL